MTDRDNITLPREVVVQTVRVLSKFYDTWPKERNEAVAVLRTALAAEQPKQEPVATVGTQIDSAWKGYDGKWCPPGDPTKVVHLLRDLPVGTLLYAAPPDAPTVKESLTHPGYVIGSHWLETAYSRICAGEAEADVLRDIGLVRITDGTVQTADIHATVDRQEALRRDAELGRWIREETPPIEEIAARVDAMEDKR